jgi:hypothetical protein
VQRRSEPGSVLQEYDRPPFAITVLPFRGGRHNAEARRGERSALPILWPGGPFNRDRSSFAKEKPVQDYFGEKSQQVEPSCLTVFGIPISSRYGEAGELIELMRFAELAARGKVSH